MPKESPIKIIRQIVGPDPKIFNDPIKNGQGRSFKIGYVAGAYDCQDQIDLIIEGLNGAGYATRQVQTSDPRTRIHVFDVDN